VSLLFSDLCRENSGSVGSDRRVDGIRDVNFIALRELIDSEPESGLRIFAFSALYLTVPPSSAN
jgi:hypothetical protein